MCEVSPGELISIGETHHRFIRQPFRITHIIWFQKINILIIKPIFDGNCLIGCLSDKDGCSGNELTH